MLVALAVMPSMVTALAAGEPDLVEFGFGGCSAFGGGSRLEIDGRALTGDENAFPFRAAWASRTELFYTSDGKIRKRTLSGAAGGGGPQTVEFSASLGVSQARYAQRRRDVDSRTPRRALGIVAPAISPICVIRCPSQGGTQSSVSSGACSARASFTHGSNQATSTYFAPRR